MRPMSIDAIRAAIQLIPQHAFTERVAAELASTLEQRVLSSCWSHQDHANSAAEYLQDAFCVLDNKADEIEDEEARVEA